MTSRVSTVRARTSWLERSSSTRGVIAGNLWLSARPLSAPGRISERLGTAALAIGGSAAGAAASGWLPERIAGRRVADARPVLSRFRGGGFRALAVAEGRLTGADGLAPDDAGGLLLASSSFFNSFSRLIR